MNKMLQKLVLAFALLTVLVYANPVFERRSTPYEGSEYNRTVFSLIALEEPCVRQGGLCLKLEDCKPSNLVTIPAVLCPKQRHLGVVCCYN